MKNILINDSKNYAWYSFFIFLFVAFTAYWIYFHIYYSEEKLLLFSFSYWASALIGSLFGLVASWRYGKKSYLGKLIFSLSLGLLMQVIGQNMANYYYINDIDIYPSGADFAFLASIPFYIYGSLLLIRVTGAQIAMHELKNKLICCFIFAAILLISYYYLLVHIEYDWSHPFVIILDFGYPFGQSIYIALVLVVFFLSRKYLGGSMKTTILILLAGLFTQYLADYYYSFLSENESWVPGGLNDYMYFLGYFLLGYALFSFDRVYKRISSN